MISVGEVSKSVVYEVSLVFRWMGESGYSQVLNVGHAYFINCHSERRSHRSVSHLFVEGVVVLKVGVVQGEVKEGVDSVQGYVTRK